MNAKNALTVKSAYGRFLKAFLSNKTRCPSFALACGFGLITERGISRVPSAKEAIMRVVQGKPIWGRSWRNTVGYMIPPTSTRLEWNNI